MTPFAVRLAVTTERTRGAGRGESGACRPPVLASQCDDAAMLRVLGLVIAASVLAAGCALVEPPPPPGTTQVVAQVTNTDHSEVELAVATPSGVLAGAVNPSRLPPRGTREVAFYLPLDGDWTITVNGTVMFDSEGFDGCPGGTLSMDVSARGGGGISCRTPA